MLLFSLYIFINYSLQFYCTIFFIQWTNDGSTFLCHCGGSVQFLDVESGKVCGIIGDEEVPTEDTADVDLILTFTLSPNNEQIVSAHKSGLFKLWNFKGIYLFCRTIHVGSYTFVMLCCLCVVIYSN